MKFKKAQGEIITTVLIILLVLAAIVIVWQVVNSTVGRAGEQAETASSCLGIQMSIEGAVTNFSNFTGSYVRLTLGRGNDNVGVDAVKVIVTNSTGGVIIVDNVRPVPASYGSAQIIVPYPTSPITPVSTGSNTVAIAPKIGTTQCDPVVSKTFSA